MLLQWHMQWQKTSTTSKTEVWIHFVVTRSSDDSRFFSNNQQNSNSGSLAFNRTKKNKHKFDRVLSPKLLLEDRDSKLPSITVWQFENTTPTRTRPILLYFDDWFTNSQFWFSVVCTFILQLTQFRFAKQLWQIRVPDKTYKVKCLLFLHWMSYASPSKVASFCLHIADWDKSRSHVQHAP